MRDLDLQYDIEKVTHTESAPTIGFYFEKYLKGSENDGVSKKHGNFFQPFLGKTNMIKSPFEYLSTSLNGVKKDFHGLKKENVEDKNRKTEVSRKDMIKGWKANSVDETYSYFKLPLGALSESDFFSIKNSIENNGNFKIKPSKNVLNNAFSDSGVIVCKNKSNKLDKKRKFFGRHGKNKEYMSLEREVDYLDEAYRQNSTEIAVTSETPDILMGVINADLISLNTLKDDTNNISRILIDELINLDKTEFSLHNTNSLKAQSLDSNKLENSNKCLTSQSIYSSDINDGYSAQKTLSKSSDAVLESKPSFILNENVYNNIIIDSCSDKLDSDTEENFNTNESNNQMNNNTSHYLLSPPYTPCVNYNIQRFQQKELNSLASTNNTHMFSDASTISLDIITSPRMLAKSQNNAKCEDNMMDGATQIANIGDINPALYSDDKRADRKFEDNDNSNENTLNVLNCENNDNITKRARHPSSVTYDINVINFTQDSGGISGNYGTISGRGRPSSSSGSKYF